MRYPPLVCPKCKEEGSYYGRLRFPDDPEVVTCPHHPNVPLVEVDKLVQNEGERTD
jgi:hypothetical protein